MPEPVIPPGSVRAFERDFENHRPEVPNAQNLADEGRMEEVQVASFAPAISSTGFLARFRTLAGADLVLQLNPFVALTLAVAIIEKGQKAGWLDDNADIVTRPRSQLDS